MSTTTETALATVETHTGEIAVTAQEAMACKEIEAAIIVARKFPRNEEAAFARVIRSCGRWSFACKVSYSYPRGGQQVEGGSVDLAREVARCWGNLRFGADVIYDDGDDRTVRCWAWDLETNVKEFQDVRFKKLIYRKKEGWKKPDERDLLELTNRQSAKGVRNCILHVTPPDLKDDAIKAAKQTLAKDAAKDPEESRKRLTVAFSTVGVKVEDLEEYLGHPVRQITPDEIAELRGIWKSISDGNSVWAEYVGDKQPPQDPDAAPVTVDDLLGKSGQTDKPTEPTSKAPTTPEPESTPAPPSDGKAEYLAALAGVDTLAGADKVRRDWRARFTTSDDSTWAKSQAESRKEEMRGNKSEPATESGEPTPDQLAARAKNYAARIAKAGSGSALESVWSEIDSDGELLKEAKQDLRRMYEGASREFLTR